MFLHDGLLNPPSGMSLLGAGVLSRFVEGTAITWSVDATSGKGVPADATEWGDVASAAGIASPSALWLCQEPSGDLADSIGGHTLTAGNSPSHAASVSGWSRLAVQIGANSGSWFFNTSSLGNVTTTSHLFLAYLKLTAVPTAARDVMGLGSSVSHRNIQAVAGPLYRARRNSDGTFTDGTQDPGTSAVRPVVLKVDRANSEHKVYTDQEVFSHAWATPSGGAALINFGGAVTASAGIQILYATCFTGSAAELSDAEVRTLLEALGWTVTGY